MVLDDSPSSKHNIKKQLPLFANNKKKLAITNKLFYLLEPDR